MNQSELNKTHESGTNVSYRSNFSAIKSNILRFKNKKPVLKQGTTGGIKLPIPVQRSGSMTPMDVICANKQLSTNLRPE